MASSHFLRSKNWFRFTDSAKVRRASSIFVWGCDPGSRACPKPQKAGIKVLSGLLPGRRRENTNKQQKTDSTDKHWHRKRGGERLQLPGGLSLQQHVGPQMPKWHQVCMILWPSWPSSWLWVGTSWPSLVARSALSVHEVIVGLCISETRGAIAVAAIPNRCQKLIC